MVKPVKMGVFKEALREVKASMLKIFLFEEALNAILVFLTAYIVSSLFKISIIMPLLLSLAYMGFAAYRETRLRATKLVESKYKELQEKLSTASEYANVENRVVNELKSEVLKNLRKVEEASFLSERKIYAKSIAAIALCFAILLISPISIGFFRAHLPGLFPDKDGNYDPAGDFKAGKGKIKGDIPFAVEKSKSDIYGAPTAAKLGSREIEVIFKPAGTELSTSNVKPPEELQFNEQYPEEVVSVAAESMEERIPKEQQELVRRYFRNVVEGGK